MEEEQYLLNKNEGSLSEEEWSEDSSDCSSYYSDTDSSIPEWESYIEDNGRLLFIDCHPFVTQTNTETDSKNQNHLVKNQTRKSTRSKFLRLIRRRDSKRRSKRFQKSSETPQENKVKFHDYDDGEVKLVILNLDRAASFKFGRRSKLAESILGINISTFSDGSRIMVSGFPPLSEAKNDKNIKIGDWLKGINDIDVNAQNLNSVLEQLEGEEVKLELQRVTGVEVTKQPPNNELSSQSNFVKLLTNVKSENTELLTLLIEQSVGILFLDTDELTETSREFEGIIYCYPTPLEKNRLCQCRGVYITISHLINNITKTKPLVTSVLIKKQISHIVYNIFGNKILLFMLPDNRVSSKEILMVNNEVLRMLKFVYNSVEQCFQPTNSEELNHFFSRFFTRVLTSGLWNKAEQSIVLNNFEQKAGVEAPYQFEYLLPMAHYVPLPMEAQMQIDDALSELEACDYREWVIIQLTSWRSTQQCTERFHFIVVFGRLGKLGEIFAGAIECFIVNLDPLDCQRLFTILGSAFYHSGYLLASHFIHEDLIDIHLYCRQQGLFHLSQTEPVRSLIFWREVFPYSSNGGYEDIIIPEDSRRYLLIIGSGKDLLAVIMEAGGCTEPPEDNLGPDAFYVEEAQATLAHLQELGISELASRWLDCNPGTQVTTPHVPIPKRRKSVILGNINFSKSASPNKDNISQVKKQPEVTSILKRRSSDQGPLSQAGSVFSIPDDSEVQSEDSISQGGYSERSEVSDEPVLGRRALRERNRNNFDGSDEECSDIDDYRDGSQISNSSYDLSEIRQALLNETGDILPVQLTAGKEVVLFHYTHLDFTEGILLCPPESKKGSPTLDNVLNNFRRCCHDIHKILKNTLRFKDMSSQDMAKSVMNKSLIAIKEYGTLFETDYLDECQKRNVKIAYWVIGRLFYMPHPREIYVCYQDTIPQNVVEIAFRLAVSLST